MIHRTKKQIETSDYIFKFVNKHKRYPTIEEVMNKFNLKSTSSAWNRIETHKEISETIGRCQCCGRKL
jgi:SOS-response transcriptional repressor LexA